MGKSTLLKSMLIFQMLPACCRWWRCTPCSIASGQYIPFIGLNTHGGVIFAYMGGIALHVWTIKGYFETIDNSLEEAAALDGAATPWQAFRLVLLPLSVPIWRWCSFCRLSPPSRCRWRCHVAARCKQLHAGGGHAAISQPAELIVGDSRCRRVVLLWRYRLPPCSCCWRSAGW